MKRTTLAVLLVAIFATGCAGSLVKDASNQLKAATAAYAIAAPARADYCRVWEPKKPTDPAPPATPKPEICDRGLEVLRATYATLMNGADILATYVEVKTEDTKALVVALLPKLTKAYVDISELSKELK